MVGHLCRVILFVRDMKTVTAFYRDKLGLKPIKNVEFDPSEWIEFDAGGCNLALHKAGKPGGRTRNKFVFASDDPLKARAELIAKGVNMHKPMTGGRLVLCDGVDPEGNRFQISNRMIDGTVGMKSKTTRKKTKV